MLVIIVMNDVAFDRERYIRVSEIYLGLTSLWNRLPIPLAPDDIGDLGRRLLEGIKFQGDKHEEFYASALDGLSDLVHTSTKHREAIEKIKSLTSDASKKVSELSDKLPYASAVFANKVTLDIPFPLLFDEIKVHNPQPEFPGIVYPDISGRALIEKIDGLRANDEHTFNGEFQYNLAKVEILKRLLTKGKYELTFTDVYDALIFAQRIDILVRNHQKHR